MDTPISQGSSHRTASSMNSGGHQTGSSGQQNFDDEESGSHAVFPSQSSGFASGGSHSSKSSKSSSGLFDSSSSEGMETIFSKGSEDRSSAESELSRSDGGSGGAGDHGGPQTTVSCSGVGCHSGRCSGPGCTVTKTTKTTHAVTTNEESHSVTKGAPVSGVWCHCLLF